ncbi:MAG TPA: cytochrome c [Acidimicrobiales bacterium]|nr:cytochrome c [Acidimicrobiales bacterium]
MSPMLAITTQQKLGIAIVVALVLGWLAYLLIQVRRPEGPPPGAEIELAPNRKPYFDDDAMEGPRLSAALAAAFALTVVIAVGLPLYWAFEPSRQAGAERGFDERAAGRGFILFQPADSPVEEGNVGKFGCGGCHGNKGQGGQTTYSLSDPFNPSAPPRQVRWNAPRLDTVLLTYTEDQVRSVLVYGRPNTPMPPWGVAGGGPMNDQQIEDLIAYLKSIQKDPEEVKEGSMEAYGTDGAKIFEGECARCHTKGWAYNEPEVPGGGAFGPSLLAGATVRQFPAVEGDEGHLAFVAEGVPFGKPYGTRGVQGNESGGMPHFGSVLTPEQVRAVVEYERTL